MDFGVETITSLAERIRTAWSDAAANKEQCGLVAGRASRVDERIQDAAKRGAVQQTSVLAGN